MPYTAELTGRWTPKSCLNDWRLLVSDVLTLTKAGGWSLQVARLSKGQQQQLYLAGKVLIARGQALVVMISTSRILNAASSQLR